MLVNVLTPGALRMFWTKHAEAEVPLKVWYKDVRKSRYRNLTELRRTYPSADLAKAEDGSTLTIFNIGGNNYRLVTYISYPSQRVHIRKIMTHKEYDRWNNRGRPT